MIITTAEQIPYLQVAYKSYDILTMAGKQWVRCDVCKTEWIPIDQIMCARCASK